MLTLTLALSKFLVFVFTSYIQIYLNTHPSLASIGKYPVIQKYSKSCFANYYKFLLTCISTIAWTSVAMFYILTFLIRFGNAWLSIIRAYFLHGEIVILKYRNYYKLLTKTLLPKWKWYKSFKNKNNELVYMIYG